MTQGQAHPQKAVFRLQAGGLKIKTPKDEATEKPHAGNGRLREFFKSALMWMVTVVLGIVLLPLWLPLVIYLRLNRKILRTPN